MSQENVAVLQHFENSFIAGNLDEVRKTLHDDVVVHESTAVPYPGDFKGWDRFLELAQQFNENWEFPTDAQLQYLDAGEDGVIVRVDAEVKARATGKPFHMKIAEFYKLRDGRIYDVTVFYWDTAVMDAARRP